MSKQSPENENYAIDAYDNATLAKNLMEWMEAISSSMVDAANDKDRRLEDRVKALASLAQYLASDWKNHFEEIAATVAKDNGLNHS
tara:strand:+ start:1436 stop:1693 length:258 start_codon:yes stop_codon:yes gene_type:complete